MEKNRVKSEAVLRLSAALMYVGKPTYNITTYYLCLGLKEDNVRYES